ncbi:polysaccharide deacetylase family protein [Arenibacter sp. GZD96]|uniref:polysaccharide deacetylase family protein n=1 Tax=Aurantibrevibacter litoralis TaxID=3106030 RepID=UPI002AFF44D6|nr:polysaccharide deacetylase family protein [Arenibacter sp. GZD-96]MEA1785907.1 polysaccharide deacetylase family protein [Arenibacter sp. GZD-96]
MLLIYTHKITPRFTYIVKQLFTRVLGLEITLTTKVEDFIKHTGPKITYTKQPLQNEFFIRSNDLLFEQGINDFPIKIGDWDGIPCFFGAGERSNVPYDIFSASFYLLSRYEEYVPHMKDMHGRFPPTESVAYRGGFLRMPLVDIWTWKLFSKLQERFPALEQSKRAYRYVSVIDVTSSHCYAHRGFVRSTAGLFMDIGALKLKRAWERLRVWLNVLPDPYDNYEHLIRVHKKFGIKSLFFFQFAAYSTYDKNVAPTNEKFKHLIKSVADYSTVSLAASYSSFQNVQLLMEEKKKLSGVIHRPIHASRFRYNRVDVPQTYRNLVEAEFTDDYTMGYTHEIGFRASTSHPFYFYDIGLEVQQPIKIHPFAVHDYALLKMTDSNEIQQELTTIYRQIKAVKGCFVTVFSNELLGGQKSTDWLKVYEAVIQNYHV